MSGERSTTGRLFKLAVRHLLILENFKKFMVGGGGVGGVRPDERALKPRTRWIGVFFWFSRGQPLHL